MNSHQNMDNGHFFIDDTGTHQLTALGPPKGAPLVGPWARLLAEAALEQLEFSVAEKAFVRFEDYQALDPLDPRDRSVELGETWEVPQGFLKLELVDVHIFHRKTI